MFSQKKKSVNLKKFKVSKATDKNCNQQNPATPGSTSMAVDSYADTVQNPATPGSTSMAVDSYTDTVQNPATPGSTPRHLAIIMDGNGRWAKQRGWPRHFGHLRGVKALYQTIKNCSHLGIPYLTVFAFSTENWKRPSIEVSLIMKLMGRALTRYKKDLEEYQVRLHVLGDLQQLNHPIQKLFKEMIEHTKNHKGLNLIVAVNYGGKQEIIQAVRALSEKVKTGEVQIEDINEESFSNYLPSSPFPPPDMIIRTGAVSRLSNFYIWGSAYAEIYVSPKLWPDFNTEELTRALKHYKETHRRFGAL